MDRRSIQYGFSPCAVLFVMTVGSTVQAYAWEEIRNPQFPASHSRPPAPVGTYTPFPAYTRTRQAHYLRHIITRWRIFGPFACQHRATGACLPFCDEFRSMQTFEIPVIKLPSNVPPPSRVGTIPFSRTEPQTGSSRSHVVRLVCCGWLVCRSCGRLMAYCENCRGAVNVMDRMLVIGERTRLWPYDETEAGLHNFEYD